MSRRSRHIMNMLLYKYGEILTLVSITVTLGKLVSQSCLLVSIFLHIHTITYNHQTVKKRDNMIWMLTLHIK